MKKQKRSWTGLYIIIGMCAGFMVGIIISNLWIGTIASVIIGAIMGILMDKRVDTDKNRADSRFSEYKQKNMKKDF